jgi:hypothetical protein
MSDTEPQLQYDRIPFPTDSFSFGAMRKRFPRLDSNELLDVFAGKGRLDYRKTLINIVDGIYSGILSGEREAALIAFDLALGRQPPETGFLAEQNQVKDMLVSDYVEYGIAAGTQEAKEMIRRIEAAAQEQAREQLGRSVV